MNPPPFQPRPRKNALPTYEELSKEQDSILRLPANGRYLIKGAPGTGKTVMTLLRAASLRKLGKPVLYILYYNVLRKYCQQLVQEPIQIQSYYSWIWHHFRNTYRREIPQKKPYDYDWDATINTCWENVVNLDDAPRKDTDTHVIIDEGQDMPKGFYEYISFHYENILVAADENQQINEKSNRVTLQEIEISLGIEKSHSLTLTRNYRNTREIAAFCQTFYTGAGARPAETPVRRGIKPLLVRHPLRMKDRLVERISLLLRENPHQLFAVVPFRKDSVEDWKNRLLAQGITPWVYNGDKSQLDHLDFSQGGVVLTNFHNIKGLEFDRLYVPELRQYDCAPDDEIRMNLYVLCSRPKDILIMLENIDEGADRIFPTVKREPKILTIKEYSNGTR
jgi:DNA helicase IV